MDCLDLIKFCCSSAVIPQFIYVFYTYFYISSTSEAEIIETMQLKHFHTYHAFGDGG